MMIFTLMPFAFPRLFSHHSSPHARHRHHNVSRKGRAGHVWLALLLASSLLAGCATAPKPQAPASGALATPTVRTGRLALQVQQEPAPQSLIVSFELTGDAQNGTLRLFGPLGNTLALAQWTPTMATSQHMGHTRTFDSLDALLEALTGAPLPAAALFDWLNGRNTEASGWQADLSQYAQGKIRAQRHTPQPAASLQLVLQ